MKKNITPMIGMFAGMILIIVSIMSSGDIVSFIHGPSIVITLLGSFCGLLIMFQKEDLKNIPKLFKVLLSKPYDNRLDIVKKITELSKEARSKGILSLEDEVKDIENEIMSDGLQMVIDGVEPEKIKTMLELKLDAMERRHGKGQDLFSKWGDLAPAFGMLGTLIGLIIMLSGLDDPSEIGSGMSTALITTFYGSLFSNLFFIPMTKNLQNKTEEEIYDGVMIIEGILGIQSGTNSRLLEEELLNYLSPEEKEEYKSKHNLISGEKAYA